MEGTAPLEEMPSLVFEQPKPKAIINDPASDSDNSDADSALSDGEAQANAVESISTPEPHEDDDDGLNISSSSSDEVDGQSEDADFELESQQEEGNEYEDDDEDEESHETSKPSRRYAKNKPDIKDYELDPDLYGLRRSVCCPALSMNIMSSNKLL